MDYASNLRTCVPIQPIVLAAGNSVRFGSNKLLFDIQGKPMVRHIIDALHHVPDWLTDAERTAWLPPIVVVQHDEVVQLLQHAAVQITWNHRSAQGISTSIACGVQCANPQSHLLFCTADQPYLTAQTIADFVHGYWQSGCPLACVCHDTRTGNPAIFAPQYRADLLALTGDTGGKSILKRNLTHVYLHQTEAAQLWDLDVR